MMNLVKFRYVEKLNHNYGVQFFFFIPALLHLYSRTVLKRFSEDQIVKYRKLRRIKLYMLRMNNTTTRNPF